MTMRRIVLASGIAALLCAAMAWSASPAEKEKAATAAAEKWLALEDRGRYAESWKEGSEVLQKVLTPEKWEEAQTRVRKPLGKVVSRTLSSATFRNDLPGNPHGENVVIFYDTAFEHRTGSGEKITMRLEKDGAWRVAGYFIR
jgi:hypothetical protein